MIFICAFHDFFIFPIGDYFYRHLHHFFSNSVSLFFFLISTLIGCSIYSYFLSLSSSFSSFNHFPYFLFFIDLRLFPIIKGRQLSSLTLIHLNVLLLSNFHYSLVKMNLEAYSRIYIECLMADKNIRNLN